MSQPHSANTWREPAYSGATPSLSTASWVETATGSGIFDLLPSGTGGTGGGSTVPRLWAAGLWATGLWAPGLWSTGTTSSSGLWASGLWASGLWAPGLWAPGLWATGGSAGATSYAAFVKDAAHSSPAVTVLDLTPGVTTGDAAIMVIGTVANVY